MTLLVSAADAVFHMAVPAPQGGCSPDPRYAVHQGREMQPR